LKVEDQRKMKGSAHSAPELGTTLDNQATLR